MYKKIKFPEIKATNCKVGATYYLTGMSWNYNTNESAMNEPVIFMGKNSKLYGTGADSHGQFEFKHKDGGFSRLYSTDMIFTKPYISEKDIIR